MPGQKKPFHEVLSERLGVLAVVIIGDGVRPEDSVELRTIFETLYRGKMKAADAQMVAKDQGGLPKILKAAGQEQLSEFAEEVLNDLKGRTDEEKQKQAPYASQSERKMDHDPPIHRGN